MYSLRKCSIIVPIIENSFFLILLNILFDGVNGKFFGYYLVNLRYLLTSRYIQKKLGEHAFTHSTCSPSHKDVTEIVKW
jgi:hypothetical protein